MNHDCSLFMYDQSTKSQCIDYYLEVNHSSLEPNIFDMQKKKTHKIKFFFFGGGLYIPYY